MWSWKGNKKTASDTHNKRGKCHTWWGPLFLHHVSPREGSTDPANGPDVPQLRRQAAADRLVFNQFRYELCADEVEQVPKRWVIKSASFPTPFWKLRLGCARHTNGSSEGTHFSPLTGFLVSATSSLMPGPQCLCTAATQHPHRVTACSATAQEQGAPWILHFLRSLHRGTSLSSLCCQKREKLLLTRPSPLARGGFRATTNPFHSCHLTLPFSYIPTLNLDHEHHHPCWIEIWNIQNLQVPALPHINLNSASLSPSLTSVAHFQFQIRLQALFGKRALSYVTELGQPQFRMLKL